VLVQSGMGGEADKPDVVKFKTNPADCEPLRHVGAPQLRGGIGCGQADFKFILSHHMCPNQI
jgi:hypothetical protein